MEKLPVLIYLAVALILFAFLCYTIFYYRQAKRYEAEIGLTIPSWIRGIFVLLSAVSISLIVAIFIWLIIWVFRQFNPA